MDVLATVSTPLGGKVLRLQGMQATDALSRPFEYRVELLAESPDLDFTRLIGQPMCVEVEIAGGRRAFHGLVTRFELTGRLEHHFRFEAVLRPWLWVLARTQDCRIFQEKTTLDIVKDVFQSHAVTHFEDRTTGSYERWDYCVQYRESDLDFVSRLLEHEGIYYFFEHTPSRHVMVLADGTPAHTSTPGYETLPYVALAGDERTDREAIRSWRLTEEIRSGRIALTDYNFETPSVSLLLQRASPRPHDLADHEVFDYPGGYVREAHGEQYTQARLEEAQASYRVARGTSDARGLACGALFEMSGFDRGDQNIQYLLTRTAIEVAHNDPQSTLSTGASLQCTFEAIPADEPYRPPRITPKSLVRGPQTAVVVGPEGDEIFTDRYGRVKVQFHWDRYGRRDASSSCWIRVSQAWAGKNFGFMAVPRIGQEVIVDFLEGDPDRPIITGRVYNAEQMPPWDLPASKTQTGILTRSTLKGSSANANAIRFEDQKGSEQLWIHAEKNQDIEVEADETHWVGHDRSKTIDHDETVHVRHDRTETVDNNESITIGVNRTERVGVDETVAIGANRAKQVGANDSLSVGANQTYEIGANQTETVGASRTTAVALNDALVVGVAQEIAIGAARVLAVGASQSTTIGTTQSVSVGASRSVSVGSDLSTQVGAEETRTVGGSRNTTVGKDDALKVAKAMLIDAGEALVLKTGSASITMKKDGTIVIKGKDVTIEGSGKINVKASSDVVVKGSKILNN